MAMVMFRFAYYEDVGECVEEVGNKVRSVWSTE